MTKAERFAGEVVKGKKKAPKLIIKACERFLSFIERDDIEYKPEVGEAKIKFIETHVYQWEGEWEGKPFILEPWQQFVVHSIFSFFKDGRRVTTRIYIQVPRKNGKTALMAALVNEHLFADKVKTPQVLIGANNEDQAKICSTATGKMIKASPTLNKYVEANVVALYSYKDRTSSISHKSRNGMVVAMSKELKSKDGFNPSLGVVDEYHEAPDSKLLDVIRSGQGSRPEPLLLVITTAGFKKSGPCYSVLRKVSIEILRGKKKDDSHFSMIYEPDEGDDWTKEKTWKKVNPNYGVSVFPHYFDSRYLEAKNEGAWKEVDFKTKNLNVWSDSAVVWLQDEIWMKCDGKVKHWDLDKRWYLGIDMAVKVDWTAVVLVSEPDEDGIHDVIPFFWIPEDSVAFKQDTENANLLDWIDQCLVFTTPGNVTDHDQVGDFILKLREKYTINQAICDQAYAISLMNVLNSNGLEAVGLPQSASKLTTPITTLYKLVMQGKIRHGGNPILRWMIGNCLLVTYTNDLIKLTKEDDINRIDGVDALVNALVHFTDPHEPETHFIAEVW